MTPKNVVEPPDDESRGVLDDAASLDTAVIGILGNTAQVSVQLPQDEEDDLEDDGIVEGEVVADLIVDEPVAAAKAAETVALTEISDAALSAPIVIELPPEPKPAAEVESALEEEIDEVPVAEIEAEDAEIDDEADAEITADAEEDAEPAADDAAAPDGLADAEDAEDDEEASGTDLDDDADAPASAEDEAPAIVIDETEVLEIEIEEPVDSMPEDGESEPEDAVVVEPEREPEPEPEPEPDPAVAERENAERAAAEHAAAEAAAAAAFIAQANADVEASRASRRAVAQSTSAMPTIAPVKKESTAVADATPPKAVEPRATRSSRADMQLTSRRIDEIGEASRESADLLTADRLLDPHRVTKPEPEGVWSHFLYAISGRRINIGDGRRARERKALTARIAAPLVGGARFVPVLSRKGGVGKTTITALLGMALADAREDRVIAVDANPDRGTLADRVVRPHHNRSVRDLVRIHDEVRGYHDISAIVARDATRLDVLASDADPRIAEAFSDSDYRDVAGVAAHYYSLVLTDTGTGIVHSVMSATLDLADQIVIVSGLSVDEARLASETLTWLETNGYAEQAREAVVVLNQSTPGAPLVRLNELESHFRTRTKHVVRMPYDAHIAGGGTIVFTNLQPETRVAARELAALLVEGLRSKAA